MDDGGVPNERRAVWTTLDRCQLFDKPENRGAPLFRNVLRYRNLFTGEGFVDPRQ